MGQHHTSVNVTYRCATGSRTQLSAAGRQGNRGCKAHPRGALASLPSERPSPKGRETARAGEAAGDLGPASRPVELHCGPRRETAQLDTKRPRPPLSSPPPPQSRFPAFTQPPAPGPRRDGRTPASAAALLASLLSASPRQARLGGPTEHPDCRPPQGTCVPAEETLSLQLEGRQGERPEDAPRGFWERVRLRERLPEAREAGGARRALASPVWSGSDPAEESSRVSEAGRSGAWLSSGRHRAVDGCIRVPPLRPRPGHAGPHPHCDSPAGRAVSTCGVDGRTCVFRKAARRDPREPSPSAPRPSGPGRWGLRATSLGQGRSCPQAAAPIFLSNLLPGVH